MTPFGQRYYAEQWQQYRQLYPEVEAPMPMKESEAQP
jgi:hypothetical protein